ncbi:MAG: oligosaccharide flippase family protein [Saccharofermentans sp.]|nr:oligosaccharide flippase family protein [Saccharofermentans sp.]
MSDKRTIAKTGLIGVINQMIFALLGFVSRKLFIVYIGTDILGLSGTYSQVLSTLALADLGFDIAVTYALYKPLNEGDEQKINAIMRALKSIYNVVGIAFIFLSFAALPFLKFFITDMEFKDIYYVYFLAQALASASTYFFAYRRTLLVADKKEYVTKTVDTVAMFIFSILKIVVLVVFKSYLIYVLCSVVQAFVTNIYIYMKCYKVYPYLDSKIKTDKKVVGDLLSKIKDICLGKISGYVYGCTDMILISKIISTVVAGYYYNYLNVITIIKQLSASLVGPLAPFIGRSLAADKDPVSQEKSFRMYTYVRYIVAVVLLVPTVVLVDLFVEIWLGPEFVMESIIVILVCADLYISLVHSSLVDFMNGSGLFNYEKWISLAGAVVNLGTSIYLAYRIGLPGVLIGTVIAQCLYWTSRSCVVYARCFKSKALFARYWIRMLVYLGVFVVCVLACFKVCSLVAFEWKILTFVVRGILCEIICIVIVGVAFIPSNEHRVAVKWALDKVKGKLGYGQE